MLDESSTTIPTAATGVDVRVIRTINAGVWSTICLPFAMTEAQVKAAFGNDVQLGNFTSWSSEEDGTTGDIVAINVGFTSVSSIEANHPYIIKVSSAVTEFTVDNVDIDPEDDPYISVGRRTTLGSITGTYVANTTIPVDCLFLSNGEFWYSTGLTKSKGYRAFFEFADVLTQPSLSRANTRVIYGDGSTTNMHPAPKNLEGADVYYNLNGQRVMTAGKGIYIRNGSKIIINNK